MNIVHFAEIFDLPQLRLFLLLDCITEFAISAGWVQ